MSDFYTEALKCICRIGCKCIWCGEEIARGDSQVSQSGRFDGRMYRNRYHPECWAATATMLKIERYFFEDGFEPYAFKRGCVCERGCSGCRHCEDKN